MGVLHRHGSASHRDQLAKSRPRGPGAVVRLSTAARLGAGEARRLEDAYNRALDEGAAAVLIDLHAVLSVDPVVVHTLLRIVDQGHCVSLEFRLSAPLQRLLAAGGVRHHLVAEAAGPWLRRRPRGLRSRRRQLL
jgi:anti-anti-sigma regulatory factor